MSEIVAAQDIERIVGVRRHPTKHWAKAVSVEQEVFILHSADCLASTPDLRDCLFSLALDNGIDVLRWEEDEATEVEIEGGFLWQVSS